MQILFLNYISNGPAFNSGIAALSGILKAHNFQTSIINITNDQINSETTKKIQEVNPDIIGFSVHTPHWGKIKRCISQVKKVSNALLICGGYHPTICPEEVINHPDVDIVCRGEGDYSLLELAERTEQQKDISGIRGLWVKVRDGGTTKVIKNPISIPPRIEELPYWDRDLFLEVGLTIADFSLTQIVGMPIASGRGCPYRCSFCNNSSFLSIFNKNKAAYVRKRNVPAVITECLYLVENYAATGFEFWDEMFAVDRNWIVEFCKEYENRVSKPFICAMRVERAELEILEMLKKSGCRCVFLGVETGNEAYRQKFLNRKMSNRAIEIAFDNAKKVGLDRFAWVMFGLPDETPAMIEETIQFLLEIKPDMIGWSVYHPLPGTRLFDYCSKKHYLRKDDSGIAPYKGAPEYIVPVLDQPSLSVEQIKHYCRKFRSLEGMGFIINK